jgi:hypothetical protein
MGGICTSCRAHTSAWHVAERQDRLFFCFWLQLEWPTLKIKQGTLKVVLQILKHVDLLMSMILVNVVI